MVLRISIAIHTVCVNHALGQLQKCYYKFIRSISSIGHRSKNPVSFYKYTNGRKNPIWRVYFIYVEIIKMSGKSIWTNIEIKQSPLIKLYSSSIGYVVIVKITFFSFFIEFSKSSKYIALLKKNIAFTINISLELKKTMK